MAYFPMTEINPNEPIWWMVAGLVLVALMVLILPFKVKWCEHNLEIFFLIMGNDYLLAVERSIDCGCFKSSCHDRFTSNRYFSGCSDLRPADLFLLQAIL
jgi:hypothetical protein